MNVNEVRPIVEYIEEENARIVRFIDNYGDLYDAGADEFLHEVYLVLEAECLRLLKEIGISIDTGMYCTAEIVPIAVELLKNWVDTTQ